jgi:hypothetical protein
MVATPFLHDSFIHYFTPVYPDAIQPQRQAQREVAEFARYREFSRACIESECTDGRARGVEDTFSPEEKNGGSDPPGSCTRNRPTAARHLGGAP